MGFGSFFKSLVKVGAPIAGAVFGGPAGLALGTGVSQGLSGNDAAKQSAENQRQLGQFDVDTKQSGLTRRAALIGSLLAKLAARPDTYGGLVTGDLFGFLPGGGRGLSEDMLRLPAYPKLRGGTSSFLAGLLGGVGGLSDFIKDRDAADRDVEGRVNEGAYGGSGGGGGTFGAGGGYNIFSPGQPVGALENIGGVDILPTRRLAGRR